jgi:hypothetical protein
VRVAGSTTDSGGRRTMTGPLLVTLPPQNRAMMPRIIGRYPCRITKLCRRAHVSEPGSSLELPQKDVLRCSATELGPVRLPPLSKCSIDDAAM